MGDTEMTDAPDGVSVTAVPKDRALDHPDQQFALVAVSCPVCGADGQTNRAVNTCVTCGAWFLVQPAQPDQPEGNHAGT